MPPPRYHPNDKLLRTLEDHVLPLLVGTKDVRQQWFVWADWAWMFVRQSSAVLSSFGVGAQFAPLLPGGNAPDKTTPALLLESLTGPWFIAAAMILVVSAVFWAWIRQANVPVRAAAARRCADGIQAQYDRLYRVLDADRPSAQVSRMKLDLWELADAARKANAWPWPPPVPRGDRIERETAEQIAYIREHFMGVWTEAAGVDRRE